jgi:PAS domain S-box-containing protein
LSRLVLLLTILILIGVVMWLVAMQAYQRASLVQHTLRVELSLGRLLADVKAAASSQHAFLYTGDEEFRNSRQASANAARDEVAQLAQLTANNLEQQASLSRLRGLLDTLFTDGPAAHAKNGTGILNPPADQAGADGEQEPISRVQEQVNAMFQEEEQLLHRREVASQAARTRFFWSLLIGYWLIVAIIASLYISVRRHAIHSALAEAKLSALNADLDERIRQRTALLHQREELLNIFVRYVPAAVAMLDKEMRHLQVSDRWCSDYGMGREQFIGQSHYELFPYLPERWKAIHQRCLQGETLSADEDRWERNGRVRWVRWAIRPWGSRDGQPEGILIFTEDITARKEIEDALRESEANNRTLFETAPQAILVIDEDGSIVRANQMAGEIFGYPPSELVGQSHEILVPPRLRKRHRAKQKEFFADPRPKVMGMGLNVIGLRKDGTEFPVEVNLSGLQSKDRFLAVSFVSDITERKEAEAKLLENEQKLRALAGSLLTAQEDERRKLARELHDDVTQQLAFLSIELGGLAGELPDSMSELRERMRSLQNQTSRASTEVRRISHGLHPSVITDFGLSVALEEFCEEFGKAHRIRVVFEGSPADSQLNDAAATCLYRIAQESVRNAMVHGHATAVQVTLQVEKNAMQLRVRDNGSGSLPERRRSKTGLGIVSMMERVRLVNGKLNLTSEAGQGTTMVATVPLMEESR